MTRRNFFGLMAAIPAGAVVAVTTPPPLNLEELFRQFYALKRARRESYIYDPTLDDLTGPVRYRCELP